MSGPSTQNSHSCSVHAAVPQTRASFLRAGSLGVATDSRYHCLLHGSLLRWEVWRQNRNFAESVRYYISAVSTILFQSQGLLADPECLTNISKEAAFICLAAPAPTSLITPQVCFPGELALGTTKPPKARKVMGKMEKNPQEKDKV